MYVDTLRLAFEGNADGVGSPSAYVADAVDLGIRVLEPAEKLTEAEVRGLVGGARATIVVVIGDQSGTGEMLEAEVGKDRVLRVEAPPRLIHGPVQVESASGIEPGFAPVVTTLRTMERARRVLARGIGGRDGAPSGRLKLFISHAKTDGLAMANSLIGVLRQLQEADRTAPGFDYFYDAEHIEAGSVWRGVLEAQARESTLIALRTEAYETRYWCRREFLLAESSGMPIIVVDLRKEQYQGSALLPFDAVPTVRVHDGNLVRVVLHAIGAHLRALRVESEAPAGVKVLPHRPSVYSLAGGEQGLVGYSHVAHPGPKVPDEYEQAVRPILSLRGSPARLVTFDDLE